MRALALVAVCACSYERPADVPNGGGNPDARQTSGADAHACMDAPKPCNAKPSYTDADVGQQKAVNQSAGNFQQVAWGGALSNGAIQIELISKAPPFSEGLMPGTFPINSVNSAGLSVLLYYEIDNSGQPHDWYEASSGMVQIDVVPMSAAQGPFMGKLQDLQFVHLMSDASGQPTDTVLTDCRSAIPAMTFSVVTTAQ